MFRCRRLVIIAAALVLVMGVGWLARARWLPLLLRFLDVTEEPRSADYIVVLGQSPYRTEAAIELYQAGYASMLIVCGCGSTLQSQLDLLSDSGVPDDAVLVRAGAQSTWEEAEQVLALLRETDAESALIVTDNYHSRRARATYNRQHQAGVRLTFVRSTTSIAADNWWQTKWGRMFVLNEYPKLAFYFLRYGVWPF